MFYCKRYFRLNNRQIRVFFELGSERVKNFIYQIDVLAIQGRRYIDDYNAWLFAFLNAAIN